MAGHALVVGGTGMLRGVCLELAARGLTVSVVARRHSGLASLRQDVAARTGRGQAVNPVAVDYADIPSLAMGLRAAMTAHGPFSMVVCWIHSAAAMAPIVVADMAASASRPCPYVHIVGSQSPDELRIDLNREEIAANAGLSYRRVILGFAIEGAGSRWLTHEEICQGVVRAVDDPLPEQVVGTVTPWERRPR